MDGVIKVKEIDEVSPHETYTVDNVEYGEVQSTPEQLIITATTQKLSVEEVNEIKEELIDILLIYSDENSKEWYCEHSSVDKIGGRMIITLSVHMNRRCQDNAK